MPINAAKMVDDLLLVHGHEIFVDGTFNADPHAHVHARRTHPPTPFLARLRTSAPLSPHASLGHIRRHPGRGEAPPLMLQLPPVALMNTDEH